MLIGGVGGVVQCDSCISIKQLQSARCQLKTSSCFSVLCGYPLYLIDVNDSVTLWEALFTHIDRYLLH